MPSPTLISPELPVGQTKGGLVASKSVDGRSTLNSQLSTLNSLRGLRVCFLAGTLGQGGAERQLYYILRALKQSGVEVRLLSLSQGEFWENPIGELGVRVVWVGQKKGHFARLAKIVREVRKFGPDLFQSQHFFTNSYVALAARLFGCKDVGAIRNNAVSEVLRGGPLFGRLHLRLPRLLAANSLAAIANLRSIRVPENDLFYLPNVVDTDAFRPWSERNQKPFVILGIGRLVPEKRFDRFLEVVAVLRDRVGDVVTAIIAGDGPLRANLEKRAKELGLFPNAAAFAGKVPDPQRLYQQANALLLTSEYEGTPNVIIEAMASGLPVVATNVGGVAGLVAHGRTGFLFDSGDSTAAVILMERFLYQPELAAGVCSRARTFIEEHHSSAMLPQLLHRLYQRVLNAKN